MHVSGAGKQMCVLSMKCSHMRADPGVRLQKERYYITRCRLRVFASEHHDFDRERYTSGNNCDLPMIVLYSGDENGSSNNLNDPVKPRAAMKLFLCSTSSPYS